MQNLITLFIVLAACLYVGGRLLNTFRSEVPSCDCSGCDCTEECPPRSVVAKKEYKQ